MLTWGKKGLIVLLPLVHLAPQGPDGLSLGGSQVHQHAASAIGLKTIGALKVQLKCLLRGAHLLHPRQLLPQLVWVHPGIGERKVGWAQQLDSWQPQPLYGGVEAIEFGQRQLEGGEGGAGSAGGHDGSDQGRGRGQWGEMGVAKPPRTSSSKKSVLTILYRFQDPFL